MPGPNWKEIDQLHDSLAVPRLSVQQQEDEQIKFISYDFDDKSRFKTRPSHVEIIHITDLQIGSKNFMHEKFTQYSKWILAVPHRFVVIGGDVIDAATLLSVGHPHDNTGEPIQQVREAVEILKPLSKAGRILGYVGGNHERRTRKTFGDCGELIAELLQIPYSGGIQLIDLHYGNHDPFCIALWHGSGSARTKGAKAQKLHAFMQKADANLYLIGHLHDVVVLASWRMVREGGKIRQKKIMGVMSSSFQGYWNSYAEQMALDPADTMMGRVILTPDGKWEVTLK